MAGNANIPMIFASTDGNSFHTAYFPLFTDHPLHSTAVDAYGEERSESESISHVSAPQTKNTGRRSGEKIITSICLFIYFRLNVLFVRFH